MLASLFHVARPLIHRMDAETAHRMTIAALAAAPAFRISPDDPVLSTEAFGLSFPNPVGLAAGFDKNAEAIDGALGLGFGFVEAGGVTPLPQPGNPRPRVFRLLEDAAVINRYGLNSEGMEAVARRLAARRGRAGIVGVNLGANKDSVDREQDYAILARRLAPLADFLTINVSSPNTPGLRNLQAENVLDGLVERAGADAARADLTARHRKNRCLIGEIGMHLVTVGLGRVLQEGIQRGIQFLEAGQRLQHVVGNLHAALQHAGGIEPRQADGRDRDDEGQHEQHHLCLDLEAGKNLVDHRALTLSCIRFPFPDILRARCSQPFALAICCLLAPPRRHFPKPGEATDGGALQMGPMIGFRG